MGGDGLDGMSSEVAESRDAARAVHASAQRMTERQQRERLLQEDACALYGERCALCPPPPPRGGDIQDTQHFYTSYQVTSNQVTTSILAI